MNHYRIRPCNGNKQAWLLVRVREDGSESDSYGSFVTAMSVDGLLERAKYLRIQPSDRVEFINRPLATA